MATGTASVFWCLHLHDIWFLRQCVPDLLRPGGGGSRTLINTSHTYRKVLTRRASCSASHFRIDRRTYMPPMTIRHRAVPCRYVLSGSNRLCGSFLDPELPSSHLILRTSPQQSSKFHPYPCQLQ